MNFELCFIVSVVLCWKNVASIKVKVEQGWLRGQILVPSTGKGKYNSFKGIPYAAPPVGNLRFRAPNPPIKWRGTRNATEHGSVCVQYESLVNKNVIGNEDCLFLNVYSPNLKPRTLLPVMFFIHGGYFTIGSGNVDLYAPDFLMDYDIVLVTINYRLDIFGFLSVNTEEVPGNAGMKDQIAALQWVQKNIRNFGGNPNCVTVFGQSAGGSAVSLHVVSPAARGLFKRAAIMSGVFYCDWSIQFEPEKRAFALGKKLGLDTNDPYKLIKYLQNLPSKALLQTRPNILLSDKASASVITTIYFTPVVEKKFGNGDGQYLTECPNTLMCRRQVNQVDIFIGHTAQECLGATIDVENNILKYYSIYKQLLVPLKISYYTSQKKVLELADRVQNFYFGSQSISLKTIRDFVSYYSYSHFVYDIHEYIERLPKFSSTKRFFYVFAIYSSRNIFSKPGAVKYGIKQATHRDDLLYLFDGTSYNLTVDVNGKAFKYVQLMCRLYTNFAKYGTPTTDDSLGLIWPEYDPDRNVVVIGKTGKLTAETVSYSANTSLGFWRRLYLSAGINY